jgi:hypothetical protein
MECLTNIFAVKKISTLFQGRKQKIFHRVQQPERTLVSMPATENIQTKHIQKLYHSNLSQYFKIEFKNM